jgi:hypothetical protein
MIDKCSKCGCNHVHVHDQYGIGNAFESMVFGILLIFTMLFCGQCSGCVDFLSVCT